jgi:hypothetical protein
VNYLKIGVLPPLKPIYISAQNEYNEIVKSIQEEEHTDYILSTVDKTSSRHNFASFMNR